MATAFFCPTSTANLFRALALVDGCGVSRHKCVEFAEVISDKALVKPTFYSCGGRTVQKPAKNLGLRSVWSKSVVPRLHQIVVECCLQQQFGVDSPEAKKEQQKYDAVSVLDRYTFGRPRNTHGLPQRV